VSVLTNWKDNPWFPQVLRREMQHDFEVDEEEGEHVWNGAYQVSQGAILARQVDRAEREGRINDDVAYDAEGPGIEISSDLGYRDTAAWWFWQRRAGGAVLLDYMEDSGFSSWNHSENPPRQG
jgi:phage terminase large subunit